jgi:hypothetical protein
MPEMVDLFSVIGNEAAHAANYCSREYRKWEDQTARPLLEQRGYSNVSFSMGEHDSFGPLSRIVTATRDGVKHRFIYG